MSRALLSCALLALAACGGAPDCEPCDELTPSELGIQLCSVDADCEPEPTPEPEPEPIPPPETVTVDTFNTFGGFELSPGQSTGSVPGWRPMGGCAWGDGMQATTEAKDAGNSGLALTQFGCRAESIPTRMPDTAWNANLRFSGNIWGRPCPPGGCLRVTLAWFDATGARVVGTPPVDIPPGGGWVNYKIVASRPYNAASLAVWFESHVADPQGIYLDGAMLEVY